MPVLLQARLKVRRVEFQVRSVRRRYCFQVGEAAYSVHHVALKPKEGGESQGESYPNSRPSAGFTY